MKREFEGFERIGRQISVDKAKRMCLDKKPFESRNEARDFSIRGHNRHGHTAQKPYKCHVCGKFHLATVRKPRKVHK